MYNIRIVYILSPVLKRIWSGSSEASIGIDKDFGFLEESLFVVCFIVWNLKRCCEGRKRKKKACENIVSVIKSEM